MIINHNMGAINAHRQMTLNTSTTQKSTEKLSSGLRINRAGDDAAGLAISEKMRGQIRGLDQAGRNAQDGISLIQTAEGALNETHSILQRMRELSVQSANDTNTDDDRAELQKEIDQLTSEINRIADTTEFNTKKLLNGDSGAKVNFGNNGNVVNATATELTTEGSYTIAVTTAAEQATTAGTAFDDAAIASTLGTEGTINVNGKDITFAITTDNAAETAASFVNALNNANIGITATGDEGGIDLTTAQYGADAAISIQATDLTAAMGLTTSNTANTTDVGVDVAGTIGGAVASGKGTTLTGTGTVAGLKVNLTNTAAATAAADYGSVAVTQNSLTLHIGANKDQNMVISVGSMTAADLGVDSLDLTNQTGANSAIDVIDDAIKSVSAQRSTLGAIQNRLEHTINNLGTSSENLTAAESRIRDVDMAKEMMNLTKLNVLSQASQAMLAQANQKPNQVLSLLQ